MTSLDDPKNFKETNLNWNLVLVSALAVGGLIYRGCIRDNEIYRPHKEEPKPPVTKFYDPRLDRYP